MFLSSYLNIYLSTYLNIYLSTYLNIYNSRPELRGSLGPGPDRQLRPARPALQAGQDLPDRDRQGNVSLVCLYIYLLKVSSLNIVKKVSLTPLFVFPLPLEPRVIKCDASLCVALLLVDKVDIISINLQSTEKVGQLPI